ncbi:hypothetical protein HC62_09795 [Acetobacter tropicalis]|uniref:Uncharacterized protein n=1 Tax=Acetobacter tropicalis TaxID=104102 RepID=A0A252A806_9PROT|nr:hypothetical protein HC62_09795 [Acetobacter tropicalis]
MILNSKLDGCPMCGAGGSYGPQQQGLLAGSGRLVRILRAFLHAGAYQQGQHSLYRNSTAPFA